MSEKLLITIIIIGLLLVVFGPMIMRNVAHTRIQKKGVRANARILEIRDTGSRRNKNPVVRIKLMVTDAAGREFPGEVEMPVSPVYASRYQPGKTVRVKYLPDSPSSILIDAEK
jgi:hypothetical protein